MARTAQPKKTAEEEQVESVFQSHIKINPEALDVEWLQQPQLFALYSEMEADAKAHIDSLKLDIDIYKADLDLDIRRDPEKFGLEKTTEATILNAVTADKGLARLSHKLNRARHEASIFQAAVRALDHRKAALENLVRLHGSQWFAGPSAPRDLPHEVDRIREITKRDVIRKVRKAMSRAAEAE